MKTIDMARKSEAAVLRWLLRFGYLTPAQIGRLLWPHSTSKASRLRMAQRVIARLAAERQLLVSPGAAGNSSHVALSSLGAARVRAVSDITGVLSGKDMLRTISSHRDSCNDVAIGLLTDWAEVWTEREILTLRAPFQAVLNKVPDSAAADAEGNVLWIEVENCRRGGRDLKKLAQWLKDSAFPLRDRNLTLDIAGRYFLSRVRFVLAAPEAQTFPERLARVLDLLGWSREQGQDRIEFQWPDGRITPWEAS